MEPKENKPCQTNESPKTLSHVGNFTFNHKVVFHSPPKIPEPLWCKIQDGELVWMTKEEYFSSMGDVFTDPYEGKDLNDLE